MQEHTFLAHLSFFTMSIFIHFIMDDSWIWHFTSQFQSAALNKVKNLFLKTDLLWTYLISRVNTVSPQFDWVQGLWSPTSSKHCPLLSLKSPTSVEWSWPTAFDFLYRSGTTLHVWFNCLGCLWIRIWFAVPKGCESQWMCLHWTRLFDSSKGLPERVVCAIDWAGQKKCSSTATDSQQNREYLIFNWFSFRERLPKAFLEIVCQVEWNVTHSIWPHYWILQKSRPPGTNLMRNIFGL